MRSLLVPVLTLSITFAFAQTDSQMVLHPKADKDLRFNLNDNGSHYIKATFTGQVWLRYNESNPGSTVNGYSKAETYDIGLRRVRMQLFGKVTDRVFVYTQFGINNFGYNTARKPGLFFHDVVTEYYVTPRGLQIGAGLTAWNGFARYSGASVATSLAVDLPLYQQTTNDVNDQFLRKLSIYAKGKLGKLDYRIILTDPMLVDGSIATVKPINTRSDFAYPPPKLQTAAYFMYQFLDEETNLTAYNPGTYSGKKKIVNIGAGFQFQPDAVWHYGNAILKDTVIQDMFNIAVDVFVDHPVGQKGGALTAYAALSQTDYGKNYIRNLGAMNPAGGGTTLNDGGSAYPMYGTGTSFYTQAGYLLPYLTGRSKSQLQPYGEITVSRFDLLAQKAITWGAGFNLLMEGHKSKLSVGYQNRPVFDKTSFLQTDRKSMLVLQFQVAI